MPFDDTDDYTEEYCSHCGVCHLGALFVVEAFCIECLIQANRCQLCRFRPPGGDDGQRVERLLQELRELRVRNMKLEREKRMQGVTVSIKRKQLVSFHLPASTDIDCITVLQAASNHLLLCSKPTPSEGVPVTPSEEAATPPTEKQQQNFLFLVCSTKTRAPVMSPMLRFVVEVLLVSCIHRVICNYSLIMLT